MTRLKKTTALLLSLLWLLLLPACEHLLPSEESSAQPAAAISADGDVIYTVDTVPPFSSDAYVPINGNVPSFESKDYTTKAFEHYSELDALGRCGVTYACVCRETMPTEKRGNISQVKPSGWHSVQYDFVDGRSLYNRCHLIGYQLTAENANPCNLITGTRYMNTEGMLPFENMVADYVKETNHHVLYRVTPIFDGDNLVARGVQMEACSVEDNGEGVSFNVYAYNNQPGVVIDYATGKSRLESASDISDSKQKRTYIINKNNKKIHLPSCDAVASINKKNKQSYTGTLSELKQKGYTPCGKCLADS